eukprot:TRINITY_DN2019_c0_g1_i1.p1 TRINITY_DN2019_c0_g1~~TRINITY_DN2019_c0_g1_i1.p1  ORF type:complete len:101 (+),score=20.88 TRINITY_DN2019_c0_g1_i1:280-582(+)
MHFDDFVDEVPSPGHHCAPYRYVSETTSQPHLAPFPAWGATPSTTPETPREIETPRLEDLNQPVMECSLPLGLSLNYPEVQKLAEIMHIPPLSAESSRPS